MTRKDNRITDYSERLLRGKGFDTGEHVRHRDTGDGALPNSRGADAVPIERSGVSNRYLDKRDTPYGLDAALNELPPGMNIEDQNVSRADQAGEIPFKRWMGHEKGYTQVGTADSPTRKK